MTTEPSTTMPKSSAPSESRFAGMWLQVEQDGGEQQRERNRDGDDQGAADVTQEQKEDQRDQQNSIRQIAKHGAGGVVDQVAAVEMRNEFHASRKLVVVQLRHLFVQRIQRGIGLRALAQQHDAFHDVVIVDDCAIFAADGLAQLAQPHLGRLHHHPEVADANRSAVLHL